MSKKPSKPLSVKELAEKRMALCYFRLFNTPDGKKVLKNLSKKFCETRPRFLHGRDTTIQEAALIEGECNVMRDIRLGIEAGKNAPDDLQ